MGNWNHAYICMKTCYLLDASHILAACIQCKGFEIHKQIDCSLLGSSLVSKLGIHHTTGIHAQFRHLQCCGHVSLQQHCNRSTCSGLVAALKVCTTLGCDSCRVRMPSTLPASRCCGLVEFLERDLSVVRSETCRSGLRDSTGLMSVPTSDTGSGPEC